MGSNGAVFFVQSSEAGAEASQFQFCECVCWTELVVGFEVHLWISEARGLGRLVLPKVGLPDDVTKLIDGFVNVG